MKRSVISEYDKLQEKLMGYVTIMNYRYMNLCVMAEEASLLPITVAVEGEAKKLEEVATIAKKNDYQFMIAPHVDGDMPNVAKGISASHPEFKQERQTMHINGVDENGNDVDQDVPYLLLTMPEVDDERYDFLKQGVDFFYDDCKISMEKSFGESSAQITMYLAGESADDVNKTKDALDRLREEYDKRREQLRDDKLKEIEEAHRKWQESRDQKLQKQQEEDAARGEKVKSSMQLNPENEDFN